jgi:hypothetical protein
MLEQLLFGQYNQDFIEIASDNKLERTFEDMKACINGIVTLKGRHYNLDLPFRRDD